MTGEISLRGAVLPIGGLREKILAADRAGIRHVIVPKGNASDYASVPREIRNRQRLHLVSHVDEVFQIALRRARRRPAKLGDSPHQGQSPRNSISPSGSR